MTVDSEHILISQEEAWRRFKKPAFAPSQKVSKSGGVDRSPPEGAELAVLTISKGFEDLCWWNAAQAQGLGAWQYITSNKL